MSELVLEAKRTAVVVIDLQKGIVGVEGDPHSTATVIANCARLLAAARGKGAQAVLVHVGGAADGADRLHTTVDQPMRGAAPPAADWSELIPELEAAGRYCDSEAAVGRVLRDRPGPATAAAGADDDCAVRDCDRVRRGEHGERCVRARL